MFKNFLVDASIKFNTTDIAKSMDVFKRKGRALIDAGHSAKSILNIKNFLYETQKSPLSIPLLIEELTEREKNQASSVLKSLTRNPNTDIENFLLMADKEYHGLLSKKFPIIEFTNLLEV